MRKIERAEWWLFGFVLLLYGVVALFFTSPQPIWDEARYLEDASNLIGGHFISAEDPEIINGPGYPLLLALLGQLGCPLPALRAANAVLMAFATWFTYRSVLPYGGRKWALAVAVVVALHPVLAYVVPYVMSEGLALFCVAGFGWAISALLGRDRISPAIFAMATGALTWLVLTRVLFGYVLLAAMAITLLGALLQRKAARRWLRATAVLAMALLLCTPYLAHTYRLTGEIFKWSTNGGELLYWATSTNPGEQGSWFDASDVFERPELTANHAPFFASIADLPALDRERAFKERAIENLRNDPVGVLGNWVANVNRLALGFPRSFRHEELKTTVLVVVQVPILLLSGLTSFFMIKRLRNLPPEVLLLAALTLVYLGGTSLLPGLPRYFAVTLPWLGLVVAAVLSKVLHLSLRLDRLS